jgi:hypothetical protein
VRLTTVLYLRRSPSSSSTTSSTAPNFSLLSDISSKPKYYIQKQDDLYQVDQWIRFIAPGAWMLIWLWQAWATVFCVAGTVLLWPVSWVEENWGWGSVGAGKKNWGWESEKAGRKEHEVSVDGLAEKEVVGKTGLRGRVLG